MTALVIVESPNKVKKIQKYLGNGYVVAASVGHFRDLPQKEMGVAPPRFIPKYVITNKRVVSNLQQKAKNAEMVYLATDPDREGEAIAYHLREALRLKNYRR
ncbi:toprim domain-containing protein, partial [Thiolapillus sp.]